VNVLVVDDGQGLRGYDCREVLRVEEPQGGGELPFVVRFGREGAGRELRCRNVLGFHVLGPSDIRPVPAVLKERMTTEEKPWAVGIVSGGLCLLY
jgi:hypothetical protein